MTKQLKADLSLLGITIIWSASFALMKQGIKDIPPYTFIFIRFLIGAAFLSIIFPKKFMLMNRKTLKYGTIIGLFLAGGCILQIVGLQYTTASKSGFLTGLQAIFVPIVIGLLYKKLPSPKTILGIVFAIAGLGLLTLNGAGSGVNAGDLLTIVCAVCYAFQIIIIDKYGDEIDSILLTIIELAVTSVCGLILGFAFEGLHMTFTPFSTFSILFTGLLCSAVAYGVQIAAQKFTSPTHTVVIFLAEPVFSAIIAAIFLKESMTLLMVMGCILILAGMFMAETSNA